MSAPEQVWWFLHCNLPIALPYVLPWSWSQGVLDNYIVLQHDVYSFPGSVPTTLKTSLYSFSTYSFVIGNFCYFPFMSFTPSSSWTLRLLRPLSFSLAASWLVIFVFIAFRCACIFGCCDNFGGEIFTKSMYPIFLTGSLPRIRYPLVSVTWNMAFLGTWHPVRSAPVHDPVLATSESLYPMMMIIGSSSLMSLKIDL